MKVAVCYWGLTRTLQKAIESHINHLYKILDNSNIQYDIYLHTWEHPTNCFDFKSLSFKKYSIEDESEFIKYIDNNISDYWRKDLFEKYGDSIYEWYPHMLKNGLYGMESLKRVTKMMLETGITYTNIIYIRPDLQLLSDFDCNLLPLIDNNTFCALSEHWGGGGAFGINDVFAVVNYNSCKGFSFRIDDAKYYRKYVGRIAGEHYLGWIVKKYYTKIIYYDYKVQLLRN